MLKPNILLFALLLSFIGFSQVGIGTVAPTADLEIMARTSLSAGEHNGIIIPKVTALPATVAPSGTILYLEGGANAGFYFSNGSSFQNVTDILSASGTGAFYDRGTTTDVTVDTSSDSYRIGRTAFGQDSSNAAIVSIENETPAGGDKRLLDLENRNSSTAMGTNTSLINGSNTSTPGGQKAGALLNISSTGTGSHVGIENTVLVNNSSVVENYGIHNIVDGNSTATGTAYGIKSVTGNTNSSGIRYGVHSTVINDGSQNSYSGWFQGRSFAIRNQDATDGYDMPTISGNAGQVLTTDGSGTASWSDANSAAPVQYSLWQAGSEYVIPQGNTGDFNLSNCETVLNPTLINPSANLQIKVIIRVTSGQGNANFQLTTNNVTDGTNYTITNTSFVSTPLPFGALFESNWINWNPSTDPSLIQLTGFTSSNTGGDVRFNSAYILVKSQ
ncbi:hypothetical protein [Nonlabens ulvanivorans]|uniref:Uncharacterized protein n=2 Tax=Nonlabens ulvanivorans TaxID=906888 RepID=A0A084K0C7_NONUL|nr:hypothetical protein [Nonlabens ulvanivorans]KEZ94661.1 hypothetical protein IL45_00060 [Nonlabens ulvanivorans]PRX12089.1 hypothetical protein LY02_02769 [Nonlabens ulvanivorans]